MRVNKRMVAAVLVPGLALGAAFLRGADGPGDAQAGAGAHAPQVPRDVAAALRRDLGPSAPHTREQGARQAEAIELDRRLRASLGGAYAGSVLDERTGGLVVMVSDASALDEVRAAGAQARLVRHTKAELDAIVAELDAAAGRAQGEGRRPARARRPLAAGVLSWSVDARANRVRVLVREGRATAVADALARYGDAVTVEESGLRPTTTSGVADGRDELP